MNTSSRRRRMFLSLVLSFAVTLVFTFPQMGFAENVFAEESDLVSLYSYNMGEDGSINSEWGRVPVCEPIWITANRDIDDWDQYVRLGLSGESSEDFYIDGLDAIDAVSADEEICPEIRSDAALPEGEYDICLNAWFDETGSGNFSETPQKTIDIHFSVVYPDYDANVDSETGSAFYFTVNAGYTAEDANELSEGVVVENTGKNPFSIEQGDLYLGALSPEEDQTSSPDAFELVYEDLSFPVTIQPGESVKIATIKPAAGYEPGQYSTDLIFHNDEIAYSTGYDGMGIPVDLLVLREGAELTLTQERVDFGTKKPGFDSDSVVEGMGVINTGDVRLAIDRIEAPENDLFADVDYDEWPIEGGEYLHLTFRLNGESQYADVNGEYNGIYKLYAKEVDEEGEAVQGADEIVLEIPVHVKVSDVTYTVTIDMQGLGEDIVVTGLEEGERLYSPCIEAFEEEYGPDGSDVDGYVFDGFISHPLSYYDGWDAYYEDRIAFEDAEVTEDMTVYAAMLPTIAVPDAKVTIKPPKAGDVVSQEEPYWAASVNEEYVAHCYLSEEFSEDGDSQPFSGTITGGKTYYANITLSPEQPEFPYAYDYDTVQDADISINGEVVHNEYLYFCVPIKATGGLDGWSHSGSKWYYYKDGAKVTNQWIQSGGKWYYMKQDGAMADGEWVKSGGKWYYTKSGGAMASNEWVKSGGKWYHFNASGAMQTGWQKVSGSWYYFNGNGSMGYSEWRDGYWLNANGTWTYQPKGSWKKSGGRWWFGDTSGWYAKSTTIWIDGSKYSFDASGWLK